MSILSDKPIPACELLWRSKLSGLANLSTFMPLEALLSSLHCLLALNIELAGYSVDGMVGSGAALPVLICLTRSFLLLS